MCSKGTSSACSLLVCEKISPFVHGLTESKLQRTEEIVSAKASREECDIVTWCCLQVESGSLASGSKVTALSKWSAASLREQEVAMVQIFRRSQNLANVAADEQSVGKTPCPEEAVQTTVPKLCEIVWMLPLL